MLQKCVKEYISENSPVLRLESSGVVPGFKLVLVTVPDPPSIKQK
jgi:hypothetical protein